MNEYIINPSWFYWANVAGELKTLCFIAIFASIIAIILLVLWAVDCFKNEKRIIKKALIISVSILVVSIIGAVFIPSKETLVSMMVAKWATRENIQAGIETIKDIVDYIIEGIKSIK